MFCWWFLVGWFGFSIVYLVGVFLCSGVGFLGVYGHLHVEVLFSLSLQELLSYKERGVLHYKELNFINIFPPSFYIGLHIREF